MNLLDTLGEAVIRVDLKKQSTPHQPGLLLLQFTREAEIFFGH